MGQPRVFFAAFTAVFQLVSKLLLHALTLADIWLQVGQTAEALNAARAEVESAEREAMAVKKKADDLTAAAGRKSAEADNYRDKWEKMKEQVSVAKSAEREHWERAKQVGLDSTIIDSKLNVLDVALLLIFLM